MTALYPVLFVAGPCLAILSLGICLLLYKTMKAEYRRELSRIHETLDDLMRKSEKSDNAAASLRAQVCALEEQLRISSGAPVKSWNNINRRTQALRRLRAGEKPQVIAAELGMSRGEVDLLYRVHRVVVNSYESPEETSTNLASA